MVEFIEGMSFDIKKLVRYWIVPHPATFVHREVYKTVGLLKKILKYRWIMNLCLER